MRNETYGYTMDGLNDPSTPGQKFTYRQKEYPREGIVCPETSTMACASGIIEENKRSGDSMSLVGLILCDDKIVGFGDSKSTQINELGMPMEQSGRQKIDKVFRNDNYIMVTYDSNQFWKIRGQTINLDDWMKENMPLYDDYLNLLFAL